MEKKINPCKHCGIAPRIFDDYGNVGIACFSQTNYQCNNNGAYHSLKKQAVTLWNKMNPIDKYNLICHNELSSSWERI